MRLIPTICLAFFFCCTAITAFAQSVQVLSPNRGERLNAGDTITLVWTGTTQRDTVRLEYSLDSGRTWLKIAARVSDTSYRWRVPDTVAKYCLFRVAQVYGVTGTTRQSRYYDHIPLSTLDFSPDGSKIAGWVDGGREYVVIGDLVNNDKILALPRPPNHIIVNSVRYSPDGSMLAAGLADSTVCLLDGVTGTQIQVLKGHKGWVKSVSFSHDGQYIVSGSRDSTAKIWKVSTGELVRTITGFPNTVNEVLFDPTDRFIVAGGKIIDISSGTVVRPIYLASGGQISYSHNGRYIVSSHPGSLVIEDAVTGEIIQKIDGPNLKAAFSPDDSRIVTIGFSDDRTLKLWDVSSGELIDTITHEIAPLYDVAYSPDGTRIASTIGAPRVWDLLPTDASDATWSIIRIAPITVMADTIDFKQVAVGSTKDSLVDVVLRNTSDHPISITGMALQGADASMFRIVDEVLTFTLAPGETRSAELGFVPSEEREAHAQLRFNYSGIGAPAIVELKGNGVKSTVSVRENAATAVVQTMLMPVRPNPSRDAVEIEFQLAASGNVRMVITDQSGREVATVAEGVMEVGRHVIPVDLSEFASGNYYCTLKTAGVTMTRMLVVVK